MRNGMKSILGVAAVLLLFVGTAQADPFSGRYLVNSRPSSTGTSLSGYIDFAGATTTTNTFSLTDAIVADFELVVSGGGRETLTWRKSAGAERSDAMQFNAALGSANLAPVAPTAGTHQHWISPFADLDGEGDGRDQIWVSNRHLTGGAESTRKRTGWQALFDYGTSTQEYRSLTSTWPWYTAFSLSLYVAPPPPPPSPAPVPEPGSLALMGLGGLGLLWFRRKRNSA